MIIETTVDFHERKIKLYAGGDRDTEIDTIRVNNRLIPVSNKKSYITLCEIAEDLIRIEYFDIRWK